SAATSVAAATAVTPAAGARGIRSRAGIVRRRGAAAEPVEQAEAVVARRNAAAVAAALGIGPAPGADPIGPHGQPKKNQRDAAAREQERHRATHCRPLCPAMSVRKSASAILVGK